MPEETEAKEIVLSQEDAELFFKLCRSQGSEHIARQDPNFALHQLMLELDEGNRSFGTTLSKVLDRALGTGPLQSRKRRAEKLEHQNA